MLDVCPAPGGEQANQRIAYKGRTFDRGVPRDAYSTFFGFLVIFFGTNGKLCPSRHCQGWTKNKLSLSLSLSLSQHFLSRGECKRSHIFLALKLSQQVFTSFS
jgi:hypothetical protein